jgi:ATP-dependent RNA circularization protein (DNA/RNA ligase family)
MKFFDYPKIHQLGHDDNKNIFHDPNDDIYIEEKVDGGNHRFMLKDGVITFGTRSQEVGTIHDDSIGKMWTRTFQFLKTILDGKQLPETHIFFGEAMVRHSINYDWQRTPPFLGFDIGIPKDDEVIEFLPYDKKKRVFDDLGIPMVPLIDVVKAGKIVKISDDRLPESAFYDGPAEGLVYKNYIKYNFLH